MTRWTHQHSERFNLPARAAPRGQRMSLPLIAFLGLIAIAIQPPRLTAQEPSPLYEQSPYDLIKLDEENNNIQLQVLPLELPGRKVPVNPPPDAEVQVRLLSKPEFKYRVAWRSIQSVRLFEQLLLDEVDNLVREQKYEAAFPYYRLLLGSYRDFPGVSESYAIYLQRIAELALKQKEFDQALARVWVLHDFAPQSPVAEPLATQILETWLDAQPPRAFGEQARFAQLLRELQRRFAKDPSAKLNAVLQTLSQQAVDQVAQAKVDFTAGKLDETFTALDRAELLWPETPGLNAFRDEVLKQAPRITVGILNDVNVKRDAFDPVIDWNFRRDARLFSRAAAEVTAVERDWPKWQYPLGDKLTLDKTAAHWQANPAASAKFWPESLLEMQRLSAASFGQFASARSLSFVSSAKEPSLTLANITSRPWANTLLSLLRSPPPNLWQTDAPWAVADQPWLLKNRTLTPNPVQENSASKLQIRLLNCGDYDQARRMLQSGEVQILERVAPWQVAALRADRQLALEPYAARAMHLLVFNQRSAALERSSRRTGLVAAIDRSRLYDKLLRGQALEEGTVANWLWPMTVASGSANKAISNAALLPPVDPALAQLLWKAADDSSANATTANALVLAIPRDEGARAVAREIAEQCLQAGIAIEIRESSQPFIPDAATAHSADLAYWIWHPLDPLESFSFLLSGSELLASPDGVAEALWKDLIAAPDYPAMAVKLRQLEAVLIGTRQVLPLFQLPEFSARQSRVQGVGTRPVDLFQNAFQWKLGPR